MLSDASDPPRQEVFSGTKTKPCKYGPDGSQLPINFPSGNEVRLDPPHRHRRGGKRPAIVLPFGTEADDRVAAPVDSELDRGSAGREMQLLDRVLLAHRKSNADQLPLRQAFELHVIGLPGGNLQGLTVALGPDLLVRCPLWNPHEHDRRVVNVQVDSAPEGQIAHHFRPRGVPIERQVDEHAIRLFGHGMMPGDIDRNFRFQL